MTRTPPSIGDEDYRRLTPWLLSILHAWHGKRLEDMGQALDIIHDFYLSVWPQVAPRIDIATDSGRRYLATSLRRFSTRLLARERRLQRVLGPPDSFDPRQPDSSSSPALEDGIDASRIRRALDALSPDDRKLLNLRFSEPTPSERTVARELRLSRHAVRQLTLHALSSLVIALADEQLKELGTLPMLKALFLDGEAVEVVARRFGVNEASVRAARQALYANLQKGLLT